MELAELAGRLDEELRTDAYADVDPSANGLQVGPDAGEVDNVAFAVDGVAATFEAAAEADADALVVHHGISWGGFDRVTGRTYDLVESLVEHDIALYVSHLPLDGHSELGNAARLAALLGVEVETSFGSVGPEFVGQRGTLREPRPAADLAAELDDELETGGRPVRALEFGPDRVEDVAIVTGSGTDFIDEAVAAGADALVTGEGKHPAYHEAREAGLDVILAGHYATETLGVRALQERVGEWGLETTYLSHPTGL